LKTSTLTRKLFYTVLLFCRFLPGFTQEPAPAENKRYPFIQANFHTGSFWTRSEYLKELFSMPYMAIEARFGYQLDGRKLWQQYHRYPKYGFGIHYADLVRDPSDTIVGNPLSIFGFYSAPWVRFGRFTLATDLSVGLSYMGRIHDFETNPYNDVIASHVNLYLDYNLNLNLQVSNRLGINTGYGLTHYSNGRIQNPQKGVNNWGWNFGMSYLLNGPVNEFIYQDPPEFKPSESLEFMYAVGTVEAIPDRSTTEYRFFTCSFTTDYVYRYSQKGAVIFGLDVLYDGSLARSIKGMPPEEVTTWEKMYLASHLGYHFIVDRLTLLFNLGTYFRQSSYDRGYYFARAGGRYRFTDHLFGHLAIKSKNGIRSDWIEWGAAYALNIR